MINSDIDSEEFEKTSDSANELYEEALKLGDVIIKKMKDYDPKLKNGLTAFQYDLFMKLSMYILRIDIFNTILYDSNEIEKLQLVWKYMAQQVHSMQLLSMYNFNEKNLKTLAEWEKIYLDKVAFLDFTFEQTKDKTIADFILSPCSIFSIEYEKNKFLKVSEISDIIKNNTPDNNIMEITKNIINGYFDYSNENNTLDKTIRKILDRLDN